MSVIAHITDTHLDEDPPEGCGVDPDANWSKVLDHLVQHPVDEIVFGGDIGAASSHNRFFRSLDELNCPVRLVPGNHDIVSEVAKHYSKSVSTSELYDIDTRRGQWDTMFLDSSTGRIGTAQLAWLKEKLLETKSAIIFVHHPILTIDTPADRLYPLMDRKNVQALLFQHKYRIVLFCGHYHVDDECCVENVRQITTPSVSYQGRKATMTVQLDPSYFAYRRIELTADNITSELIRFESQSPV